MFPASQSSLAPVTPVALFVTYWAFSLQIPHTNTSNIIIKSAQTEDEILWFNKVGVSYGASC